MDDLSNVDTGPLATQTPEKGTGSYPQTAAYLAERRAESERALTEYHADLKRRAYVGLNDALELPRNLARVSALLDDLASGDPARVAKVRFFLETEVSVLRVIHQENQAVADRGRGELSKGVDTYRDDRKYRASVDALGRTTTEQRRFRDQGLGPQFPRVEVLLERDRVKLVSQLRATTRGQAEEWVNEMGRQLARIEPLLQELPQSKVSSLAPTTNLHS